MAWGPVRYMDLCPPDLLSQTLHVTKILWGVVWTSLPL